MNVTGQPIPAYTVVGTPQGGATAGAGVPLSFAVVGQLLPGVAIAAGAAGVVANINFDFSTADSSLTLGLFV